MEEIGDNNPWKKEWSCPRKDCLPCQGQSILGAEEEEDTLKLVCEQGETQETGKKTKEDRRSLPGCTQEGCNYVIECLPCRKAGKSRRYNGETGRSPYQRGAEHLREVELGVASHPLVLHFREEHQEERQPILMRVLSRHLTALDRQVTESLNIIRASRVPEECLNLKSEWGGSKLPNLQVTKPKGTSGIKEDKEELQEVASQGSKRI